MRVTIWGARGSVPVSSADTARHGGNTTCIEVRTDAGDCIIIDAGTGIRNLGESLRQEKISTCHVCFTHAHWDHVQGLPFFVPLYDATCSVHMYGPVNMGQNGVKSSLDMVFNGRNFPLQLEQTAGKLYFNNFTPGDSFKVGSALVETCPTTHPGGCTAYRITADGVSFMFTGDHECLPDLPENDALSPLHKLMQGVDILLVDGQYTRSEYPRFKGWGHSCQDDWPGPAARAGVKHLIFTHHDPGRSDTDIDNVKSELRQAFAHLPLTMDFAFEGMTVTKDDIPQEIPVPVDLLICHMCETGEALSAYNDVGIILDSILTETRRLCSCDAGTIYLVEEGQLAFAYAQNETLFPGDGALRFLYLNASLPIDEQSIAGYAAFHRTTVNIPDVYALSEDAPYQFNSSLDKSSGYRTVSVIAVPLLIKDRLMGVLQLINRLDKTGNTIPFDHNSEYRIERFSRLIVNALERGLMANELILRMLGMAALRDPGETAGHVRRVGAIAAEIYHRWAQRRNIDIQEIKRSKDQIRLAAMLHDVGKVGIADGVLKKNGPLDPDERKLMETHCALGAQLFNNIDWEVDAMAYDIALHHHQKWDGTGYTGDPKVPILSGEAIPLAARITAVADVYDALVSKRCYKDARPVSEAIDILIKGKGSHFDPEIIDAFLDISELVTAIHQKYADNVEVCKSSEDNPGEGPGIRPVNA